MQLRSRDALIVCLEATGMSERQLARVAGLGHATVNHLVTGRRTRCSLATARAIEAALGCGDGLLFEDSQPEDEPQWRRFGGQGASRAVTGTSTGTSAGATARTSLAANRE